MSHYVKSFDRQYELIRKMANIDKIIVLSHFHSLDRHVSTSRPVTPKQTRKTALKCFTLKYCFFDERRWPCDVPETSIPQPPTPLGVRFPMVSAREKLPFVDIEFNATLLAVWRSEFVYLLHLYSVRVSRHGRPQEGVCFTNITNALDTCRDKIFEAHNCSKLNF